MAPKEKPINDSVPKHRSEFAQALRDLRMECGSPSYKRIGLLGHAAAGALNEAANGKRLPTWEITKAFVTGCYEHAGRGEKVDVVLGPWKSRWTAAKEKDQAPSGQGKSTAEPPRVAPKPKEGSRNWRKIALAGVGTAVAAALYVASANQFVWWPFEPEVWRAKVVNTWSDQHKAYLGVFRYRSPDVPKDTDGEFYEEGSYISIVCQKRDGRMVKDQTLGESSRVWNKTVDGWWIPDLYLVVPRVEGEMPPSCSELES